MTQKLFHAVTWVRFREPPGASYPLLILQDGTISYEALRFLKEPLGNGAKSPAWHAKAVSYIGALYDFYEGFYGGRALAEEEYGELFGKFFNAAMYGTVQQDGTDASGLFWRPWPWKKVTHAVAVLREFSSFCADYYDHAPFAGAPCWTTGIGRAYAEEARRRRSILFHLKRRPNTAPTPDLGRQGRGGVGGPPRAKAFPSDRVLPLLLEGCRRTRAATQCSSQYVRQFNVQLQLALVLLAGGGIRTSELFHLFIDDVAGTEIRLYHPEQGSARWKGRNGRIEEGTRAKYLLDMFARFPRTRIGKADSAYVGWKNMLLEYGAPHNYSVVHWLAPEFAALFEFLHRIYIREIRPNVKDHPYYFVSLDRDNLGKPWTPNAFRQAFIEAVTRIGLNADRDIGVNPHGLRHRYGQTLVDMALPPQIIQYAMHHRSLESQLVYTRPTPDRVDQTLRAAAQRFENSNGSWISFDDVAVSNWRSDKLQLFTPWDLSSGRGIGK